MKIICHRSELHSALTNVVRAVPSRPTHPILGCIVLEAKNDKLYCKGFDLATGIEESIDVRTFEDGEGAIAVLAKPLCDIISRLDEGEITITHSGEYGTEEEESNRITIESTTGTYKLSTLDPKEFPDLPIAVDAQKIQVSSKDFESAISSVLFAASTEESKQVLTGVRFQFGESSELAATNGHRLATVALNCEAATDKGYTIPRTALEKAVKLCDRDLDIEISLSESHAVFDFGSRMLTTRLLDGSYPAYSQLIPTQFTYSVPVDRQAAIEALERVKVMCDQKNLVVRFDFSDRNLKISSESADIGYAVETVPLDWEIKEVAIAFNVKYLLDGLKAIPGKEMTINFNTPMQPIVFKPLSDTKMTYLVMPVQIRD